MAPHTGAALQVLLLLCLMSTLNSSPIGPLGDRAEPADPGAITWRVGSSFFIPSSYHSPPTQEGSDAGHTATQTPSELDSNKRGPPAQKGWDNTGPLQTQSELGQIMTQFQGELEQGRRNAQTSQKTAETETETPGASWRTEDDLPPGLGVTEAQRPPEPWQGQVPTSSGLKGTDHVPSEVGRTHHITSERWRTEVLTSSEPVRTEGHSLSQTRMTDNRTPSKPWRTEGRTPSERKRAGALTPSEAGRAEALIQLEPGRAVGHSLPETSRTEAHTTIEPGKTEARMPSETGKTQARTLSETGRTEAHISEPRMKKFMIPSEQGWTEVLTLSESGRMESQAPIKTEPRKTEVMTPSAMGDTTVSIASGPTRTTACILSEPGKAEVLTPSEPGSTDVVTPSTSWRTEADALFLSGRREARILSELVRTEAHILSESGRAEALVQSEPRRAEILTPSEPGGTEVLTPSTSWRIEADVLAVSGRSEALIPSELAEAETHTLPELNRVGSESYSRLEHGTIGVRHRGSFTSRGSNNSGPQTHPELARTETQTIAGPDKKGPETPPEPGGTYALYSPEWEEVPAQTWSEATMIETRTPAGPGSSQDKSPSDQGESIPVTLSGMSSRPHLSEPEETSTLTSSELGGTQPATPRETNGVITRTHPEPDGDNDETTSGPGETITQNPSELDGTANQTSNGSENGETAAKTQQDLGRTRANTERDSESHWTREPFPSGSQQYGTESRTPSEQGWTRSHTASETDWTGFSDQTEVQPGRGFEPRLVSEQDTGSSHLPVSSNDAEKRTSLSHTDSMYISTTYNRGGERTLLSITNGSMSVDITESSTYYNISKTSDSPDSSSEERTGRTKASRGDTDFTITSSEIFLTHSSKASTQPSQTYDPPSESLEPTDSFQKTSIGGSNAADPSVGSGFTTSKSEYGSTTTLLSSSSDSFPSSSNVSLTSSLSSSSVAESFSSTSSESISSSHTGMSTSFISSASYTESLSSSSSKAQRPFFSSPTSSTSGLPVTSSVPVFPLPSSGVPSSFSEFPPSSSTSFSFSYRSWPSLRPSLIASVSGSTLSTPSSASSSPSSASLPAESYQTSHSAVAGKDPEETVRVESSTSLHYSTLSTDSISHSDPPHTEDSTSMGSTPLTSPLTFPTDLFNSSLSETDSRSVTESFTEINITLGDLAFVKTTTILTTETSFTQGTLHSETPKEVTSVMPETTTLADQFITVELTTKKTIPTVSRTSESQSLGPTTDYSVLFRTSATETDQITSSQDISGTPTPGLGSSTAASTKITAKYIPASYKTTAPGKTTGINYMMPTVTTKPSTIPGLKSTVTPETSQTAVGICSPNPCLHGGKCVVGHTTSTYKCLCSPSWTGEQCATDVDECLSNPCPPKATCINAPGSFTCRCPLGYQLEKGAECSLVRTFIGQIKISSTFMNSSDWKRLERREIEGDIIQMLNVSLSLLDGYSKSTILDSREASYIVLSVQHIFSLESNVTIHDIMRSLQSYMKSCEAADKGSEHCWLLARHQLYYKADSLCNLKHPECDKQTSECTDFDGIAICQCRTGYFKYKMDYSCRACEDGYKRENGTCVRCPFGLGGFNCGNPYQLITVVIAAAGGGLLLILATALIVTCCRKNKNDISKLIFKSGDFQMSPYAEYPKNPRSSEWGRETIEMQENGSTKNLLQMTDVYYSPGLRNPEVERNGLYPYTGVPGSRHSCIYPGQYNPSFINEESRRRDYF